MKTSGRKTLLVLLLVVMFLLISAVLAKPAQTQQAVAEETTSTVTVPWVLGSVVATPVADYAPFERAIELNAQRTAEKMFADGINTKRELEASGLTGRAYEILKAKISEKEAQRAAARAAATRQAPKPVAVQSLPSNPPVAGMKPTNGKYPDLYPPADVRHYSPEEIRVIVDQVAAEEGLTAEQTAMIQYIWTHENVCNWTNGGNGGNFYGIWQLHYNIARWCNWWDPHEETHKAIAYMRTHPYDGYGTGIEAAYAHKKATGWY